MGQLLESRSITLGRKGNSVNTLNADNGETKNENLHDIIERKRFLSEQEGTPRNKKMSKVGKQKVIAVRESNLVSMQMALNAESEDEKIPIIDDNIADSQSKVANAVFSAEIATAIEKTGCFSKSAKVLSYRRPITRVVRKSS